MTRKYSNYLSCLYDEPGPVGNLGRGTHYSVFRCVEWKEGFERKDLPTARAHDFAILWDEDHDDRIIEVLERLYIAGMLSPVLFVGERKGSLSLIYSADCFRNTDGEAVAMFMDDVSDLAFVGEGDSWVTTWGYFDRNDLSNHDCASIIHADRQRVITYLSNIESLWSLGHKCPDGLGASGCERMDAFEESDIPRHCVHDLREGAQDDDVQF